MTMRAVPGRSLKNNGSLRRRRESRIITRMPNPAKAVTSWGENPLTARAMKSPELLRIKKPLSQRKRSRLRRLGSPWLRLSQPMPIFIRTLPVPRDPWAQRVYKRAVNSDISSGSAFGAAAF
jgi:hypothetical protein